MWVDRIDSFFRTSSLLPPEGNPTEYAAAFEAVYPHERLRRQYIDDAIAKGTPAFGHKVLGSLMAARKTDCVFTTNFDPLVEEAAQTASALLPAAEQARPTVAALDSADRAVRSFKEFVAFEARDPVADVSEAQRNPFLSRDDIRTVLARSLMALTKMDWNNDALYDPVPVTTTGKNAADTALVVRAMDLLHTGRFDAYVLVSSDSDFSALAHRLRRSGAAVHGIGLQKAAATLRQQSSWVGRLSAFDRR